VQTAFVELQISCSNQLSYAGIYHVNESNKVRVIDRLSIAQADKNESQEKRYQLRVVWVKCKGGDYEN
jgi:hypothetical protein